MFVGLGRQESISKMMIDMFTDPFKVVIRKYKVVFMKIPNVIYGSHLSRQKLTNNNIDLS